jgi:hypothetical protein
MFRSGYPILRRGRVAVGDSEAGDGRPKHLEPTFMAANPGHQQVRPISQEQQLQGDIVAAAKRCSLHEYIRFLRPLLEASSQAKWTAVSLATAIHRLGKCEGDIHEDPDLAGLFDALATRLGPLRERLGAREVSNALYGLHRVSTGSPLGLPRASLGRLLNALADEVKKCREGFSSPQIGMAFYGLNGIGTENLDESGRSALIEVLEALGRKAKACSDVFEEQNIAMAFYGLRGIRTVDLNESGRNSFAKVLTALAQKLNACQQELTSPAVTQIFQGIKNIDGSVVTDAGRNAVRLVLEALANKLRASTQWLQSDTVEGALESLAEISATSLDPTLREEVVNLQVVLVEKLKKRTDGLQLSAVAKAIASLRHTNATDIPAHFRGEYAIMLGNLADLVDRCTPLILNAQAIANAFVGLRGIDTAYLDEQGRRALVRLVKVLAEKTRECEEQLDRQAVGMVFVGLQGICLSDLDDVGRDVVRDTLKSLAAKANACRETLKFLDVLNCFRGIRAFLPGISAHEGSGSIMGVQNEALKVAGCVLRCLDRGSVSNSVDGARLAEVLGVLHEADTRENDAEKQELLRRLDAFWTDPSRQRDYVGDECLVGVLHAVQAFALYKEPLPVELAACLTAHKARLEKLCSPTPQEKEYQWELEGLLSAPVRVNQLVDGFKLQFSFSVDGQLYNVESEVTPHLTLSQKLDNQQRDAFLRSKGYRIIRVAHGLAAQQVAEQVLEHVMGHS